MAAHILLKNYTAPRIDTTNMCAKFCDDLVPLSRPARFHAKAKKKIQNKIQKKIQKNTKKNTNKNTKIQTLFFLICCQIEGFTRFARSSNNIYNF